MGFFRVFGRVPSPAPLNFIRSTEVFRFFNSIKYLTLSLLHIYYYLDNADINYNNLIEKIGNDRKLELPDIDYLALIDLIYLDLSSKNKKRVY